MAAEARKRHAVIPNELATDFKSYKVFLEAAERRSKFMVKEIVKLVSSNPNLPVTAIIGAAHTEGMVKLLNEKGVAVAVMHPNAYERHSTDKLRQEELQSYQRKLDGKSVEVRGLGALLNNERRPPPPVSDEVWLARKATIYQVTLAVVDHILVGLNQPPYKVDSLPKGYRVDFSKLSRSGDEIIFPITFDTDHDKQQTVWVRATHSRNSVTVSKDPESVEARINALLLEAGDGGLPPPKKSSKVDTKPKRPSEDARHIAEGIYASFANDKATLEKHAVLESDKL